MPSMISFVKVVETSNAESANDGSTEEEKAYRVADETDISLQSLSGWSLYSARSACAKLSINFIKKLKTGIPVKKALHHLGELLVDLRFIHLRLLTKMRRNVFRRCARVSKENQGTRDTYQQV